MLTIDFNKSSTLFATGGWDRKTNIYNVKTDFSLCNEILEST